jgi:hypothetical protein
LRQWKEFSDLVCAAFKTTPSVDEMRARVASANINQESLLATDYLNHFNEVAMIMEMLPDMPDFVEDVKAWEPKSYKQHFQDSTFSEKELAVAAYDCVPTPYLVAFEGATNRAASLLKRSIPELETIIQTGERERIEVVTKDICTKIEELMSMMRSIINGELETLQQGEIDAMLLSPSQQEAEAPAIPEEINNSALGESNLGGLDQNSVDSLFD